MLVELACSATLAAAYKPELASHLFPATSSDDGKERVLVFIICGGFKISVEELAEYGSVIDSIPKGTQWELKVDDDVVKVDVHGT